MENNKREFDHVLDKKILEIFKDADYTKIPVIERRRKIYEYLTGNLEYDYELLGEIYEYKPRDYKNEIMSALNEGKKNEHNKGVAVCNGISYAYKLLLERVGIESILISSNIEVDDVSSIGNLNVDHVKKGENGKYKLGHMFILVKNEDGTFSFDDPTYEIMHKEDSGKCFNYGFAGCKLKNQVDIEALDSIFLDYIVDRNKTENDLKLSKEYKSDKSGFLNLPDNITTYKKPSNIEKNQYKKYEEDIQKSFFSNMQKFGGIIFKTINHYKEFCKIAKSSNPDFDMGILEENINNVATICNNKIVELMIQFKEKDMSLFVDYIDVDGVTWNSPSVVGMAIIDKMFNYMNSAISALKANEISVDIESEKSLQSVGKYSRFFSKIREVLFRKKEEKMFNEKTKKMQDSIKKINDNIHLYNLVCDDIFKYKLEDNLLDTLAEKSVEDLPGIDYLMYEEVYKLGYGDIIPELKEKRQLKDKNLDSKGKASEEKEQFTVCESVKDRDEIIGTANKKKMQYKNKKDEDDERSL